MTGRFEIWKWGFKWPRAGSILVLCSLGNSSKQLQWQAEVSTHLRGDHTRNIFLIVKERALDLSSNVLWVEKL